VGDKVQVQTAGGPVEYHLVAIGNDYLSAKLNTIYISQADMARDFARNEDILILANLAPGADRAAVKAQMDSLLTRYPQFTMHWGADLRNEQRQVFQQVFAGFYIVALALVLPALLGLINTLAINILERTREIGMLRAIGATRQQIRRLVLAESLLLAATGTALGLLAGLGMGYALTVMLSATMTNQITYSFPLAGILFAIATALLLGVVASLLPARQAARLRIVQALQYE
jgi:putative ABC transport system permease protein